MVGFEKNVSPFVKTKSDRAVCTHYLNARSARGPDRMCSCPCLKRRDRTALREPLCQELREIAAPELQNEMNDIRAKVEAIERKTEQNSAGLCNLREMLHVFANLLINAVDSEVERALDERLGASPSSSESEELE